MIKWCVAIIALVICSYPYADIYKCQINGSTVYTDQPCDGDKIQLKAQEVSPSVGVKGQDNDGGVYSSGRWYKGYAGYQQAVEQSKKFGAPILLYFQADWCRYCRQLEKELLYTQAGKSATKQVIKVRITPDNSGADERFFKQLGGRGYPSVFIQSAADTLPDKVYLMKKEKGRWSSLSATALRDLLSS